MQYAASGSERLGGQVSLDAAVKIDLQRCWIKYSVL
jgi:hypothetical protein